MRPGVGFESVILDIFGHSEANTGVIQLGIMLGRFSIIPYRLRIGVTLGLAGKSHLAIGSILRFAIIDIMLDCFNMFVLRTRGPEGRGRGTLFSDPPHQYCFPHRYTAHHVNYLSKAAVAWRYHYGRLVLL